MDYFKRAEREIGPGGIKCGCCNTWSPQHTKGGNQKRRREIRRRIKQADREAAARRY
jgi:hypothetical protein